MSITLQSVAAKAGVSPSTASLALNGRGAQVGLAKSTLERIEKAAQELGYEANQMATALRLKRSHSVGVLWSLVGPHNTNQLVRCFSQKAHEYGYATQVYDSLSDTKLMESQIREFVRRRVDGAVIQIPILSPASPISSDFIKKVSRIPKVIASSYFEVKNLPFPQIYQSRERALHDAIKYILSKGRRKIAFLGGQQNDSKTLGLREALHKEGFSPDSLTTLTIHDKIALNNQAEFTPLIDTTAFRHFEALFTATDELAALIIASLHHDGIKVPEDIAVIGFNNSPIASFFQPAIATVERYDAHAANLSIQNLISTIENPDIEIPALQTVEMKFIPRASAG